MPANALAVRDESEAPMNDRIDPWPSLKISAWQDTCATLHLWTQIVGKLRLAQMPLVNHWWQVPLYVTARGLTTSPIPYGARTFQIDFDFVDHRLVIASSDGRIAGIGLAPRSVAEFYRAVMEQLASLDIAIAIWTMPVEIPDAIPFEQDHAHASYDPEYAERFWQVLVQGQRVLERFRARFLGKASPVHFFWGSFDLAATRFSGRRAPDHPGTAPNLANWVMREAYSHEVSSCGFWPGGGGQDAAFYSYAYPQPAGFSDAIVRPGGAAWRQDLGEFVLPYDGVRQAADPDAAILDFCQSTYEAAADLAQWDRQALERGAEPIRR
jgi:hypothetical protein